VDITLNVQGGQKDIQLILYRLKERGVVYFNDRFAFGADAYRTIATENVWSKVQPYTEKKQFYLSLQCKLEDTRFLLSFYHDDNNNLVFSFGSFSYPWIKDFWNDGQSWFDHARCVRLMLKIVFDYQIIDIKAISEC